jgi:arginyl-tRNA synthetase
METMLTEVIREVLESAFGIKDASFVVEHPKDLAHGDYATNVALVIAKTLNKNPKEVAEILVQAIKKSGSERIAQVSVAGPGFINMTLSRTYFTQEVGKAILPNFGNVQTLSRKRIMVEYTDPNPFKPFHIGHLMTNAIGEAIARILEANGAHVIRANYQGDVGLHVAKAIYGLLECGKPDMTKSANENALAIGACYVAGSKAYEEDAAAKARIDEINKAVYERTDDAVNELYDWGREVTLIAFESIYSMLGTSFDYYFFESEMAGKGKALVEEWLSKGVFEESDGAVVFRAEKYDPKLHTRVFTTRAGLPTYEAKELGLVMTKFEKEPLDTSITITADEQLGIISVVTEAIRHIKPELVPKMRHIIHGMMRFADGKMSSRTGNVITGESLLADAIARSTEKMEGRIDDDALRARIAQSVGVAAIKYAILRQGIGGNIVYDPENSVSFEGDSGPYLQYAVIRAGSVAVKAIEAGITASIDVAPESAYDIERIIARFPEVVARAGAECEPHHLVTYLIDLAGRFNSFYTSERIADPSDTYAPYKLALTMAVSSVLTRGLNLLGITVPEKM